jgi:hypothetical protein
LLAIPELVELAHRQAHVLTRAQLGSVGVDHRAVTRHVRAGRWAALGPVLVVLHRGPLDPVARSWAAVLNAGDEARLCAWTAHAGWGLRGWDRDVTHVVVQRGQRPAGLPWVRLHESRRHEPDDLVRPQGRPATHDVARATIDAAAWSHDARTAGGVAIAVVQQRLASPDALFAELERAGRVRHRRVLGAALADAAGEGLPAPRRQSIRTDIAGRRRFRDAEWVRWDGRVVLSEIDGAGHVEARRWHDDLLRDAELARSESDSIRIRLPSLALHTDRARVVAILRSVLLP